MASSKYFGVIDPVSLFARFDFTQAELLQAVQQWVGGVASGESAVKPREFATYVHELTHYLQYTTTSYGIYLQYCRRLQNAAATDLIRLLPTEALRPPLGRLAPRGSGSDADQARNAWGAWWCIENFIAAISADRDRRISIKAMFDSIVEAPGTTVIPALLDLPTTFNHIQDSLANHIRTRICDVPVDSVMNAITGDNAQRMLNAIFLNGWARADLWKALMSRPAEGDLAAHERQLEQDLSAYPWSAEAIIEGAALAAELWDSDITMERLQKWLAKPEIPAKEVYRACLRKALGALKTADVKQFLLSFMTICELVLQAPLLPAHAVLRGPGFRFEEVLPSWRFEVLIAAASQVDAITDRKDYSRYVADLCDKAGFAISPKQSGAIDCAMPGIADFPLASVFRSAQRFRMESPSSMVGVDRRLVHSDALAAQWRDSFNFLIIDYADKTTFHKDKPFMHAMTDAYLSTLALRRLMLDSDTLIPAPYGKSDGEDQYMTNYINAYVASIAPSIPRFRVQH